VIVGEEERYRSRVDLAHRILMLQRIHTVPSTARPVEKLRLEPKICRRDGGMLPLTAKISATDHHSREINVARHRQLHSTRQYYFQRLNGGEAGILPLTARISSRRSVRNRDEYIAVTSTAIRRRIKSSGQGDNTGEQDAPLTAKSP